MEGSYRGIMNIEGRKRGNIDGRCTWREARELMYMEGSKERIPAWRGARGVT